MKLVLALVLAFGMAHAQQHFMDQRMKQMQLPPPAPNGKGRISSTLWFTQKQDNFDDSNTNTYEMRYWYNDEFCSIDNAADCPVFLFLNGESAASSSWLTTGQWYLMAEEHGALMFTTEHRYYGESYPTEDWTDENMRFLSSQQGLADMAAFIQGMNDEHGLTGAWVTFGGSYAGSLSAWARQTYPDLVWAAVSSSGPLQAKLDFWEYYDTCHAALGTTANGAECQQVYTDAFLTAEEMLKDPETAVDLLSKMHVCNPSSFDFEDQLDVWSFGQYFNGVIGGTVQYNGFYSYTIDNICNTLTDPNNGEPIDRYAIMAQEVYGGGCFNIEYEGFLDSSLSVHTPNAASVWRQWYYQTCAEFGWYQTSNNPGGQQGVENMHPVDLDLQYCMDAYGDMFPSADDLQANMDASNDYYGGKETYPDNGVSNVVYVHGTVDPWHQMGIYEGEMSEDAPYILIEGSSHCADMYEPSRITSPELEEARAQIRDYVATWLSEYTPSK